MDARKLQQLWRLERAATHQHLAFGIDVLRGLAERRAELALHGVQIDGYDPLADLVPVCQVMTFDQALVVSAQVPWAESSIFMVQTPFRARPMAARA